MSFIGQVSFSWAEPIPIAPDVTIMTCLFVSNMALICFAIRLTYAVSMPPFLARVFVPIFITTLFILVKFLILQIEILFNFFMSVFIFSV